MIHIHSYLHHQSFSDLIQRWMYNRVLRHDAELVSRLVHFNSVYISRYLQRFSKKLFQGLHGEKLGSRFALLKSDLKDTIVATPPMATQRIEELIANYKRTPERYYRETPFHGTLFFKPGPHGEIFVGSNRIKRVRRLAEKSSRRIIDHIFLTIKQHADQLAADRARRLSVSRDRLISNPEEMLAEFIRAEQRLLDDLRFNRPISFDEDIQINDVAGVKVILEHNEYDRIQKFFSEDEDCEIVEEEPHFGNYNAVNLIVRYRPNKEKVLARPLGPQMLRLVERRGLDPAMANREFASFVHTGEESVNIEVIVSNYEEMLESEIGRCIHEDRIIEQRMQQEYRGPLAKNVEYLMVYLFNFAVSPQSEIGELPIKLWNRYLPDYIDEVLRALFKLPPLSLLD